jgi:hypothetical protein
MASRLYAAGLRPLSSHGVGAVFPRTPDAGSCPGDDGAPPALPLRRHDAGDIPPWSSVALGPRSPGVRPALLVDSAAGWH